MISLIAGILATAVIGAETPEDWARDKAWINMTDDQRYEASIDMKARAVGLSEEEFIFFSSAVEAESDRGYSDESQRNRILIAETIYNRVNDDRFPDTVSKVLNQSGQFSVVSNGRVTCCSRTNRSDAAILTAHEEIIRGEAPHVMYFNCIGYNGFTPYDCVGDNYFMID